MQLRKTSVSVLVVAAIVAATTLAVGVLGAFNLRTQRELLMSNLHSSLKQHADQLAISLALPLWNFDRPQITAMLDGIMRDDHIYGVVVTAPGLNYIKHRDGKWESEDVEMMFPAEGLLEEGREIKVNDNLLGHLQIFASTRFVEESLHRIMVKTLAMIAILDALIVTALSYLMWRLVLKPLRGIEQYATHVSRGEFEPEIEPYGHYGEINSLRVSIKQMVDELDSRYEAIVKAKDTLRSEVAAREHSDRLMIESMRRYKMLFDTAGDAILILKDGVFAECNAKALEMFACSREEIVGQRPEAFSPEYQKGGDRSSDRAEQMIRAALESGTQRFEWLHTKLSGAAFSAEVTLDAFVMDSEQYLMAHVRDISRRVEAEQALKTSELRYRSLIEASPFGVALVGVDGQYKYANPSACRMYGYTEDEFLKKRIGDLAPDDETMRRNVALFERVLRDRPEPFVLTTKALTKDGLCVDTEVRWTYLFDEGGNLSGACLITVDITDRLKKEEELRTRYTEYMDLSEQFTALLNAVPEEVMLISSDHRVVWANEAARRGDASDSGFCYRIRFGSDRPCGTCNVSASLASGRTIAETREVGDRAFSIRFIPVRHGENVSVLEVFADITEQKKKESEDLRACQLASLGELSAGVAHEINNPVNGIINYARLLQMGPHDSARTEEITDRIIKEGKRIATIVKNLLSFARADQSELRLSSIKEIIKDTLTLIESMLMKDGIDIRLNVDDSLPLLNVHCEQIRQVFLNMCMNARHALNDKYPYAHRDKAIEISAEYDQATKIMRVVFHDKGTGMPAEVVSRAFQPFFTTKATGVGTGLGLSISKSIISAHGGTIEIESQEGQYTNVIICLPGGAVS